MELRRPRTASLQPRTSTARGAHLSKLIKDSAPPAVPARYDVISAGITARVRRTARGRGPAFAAARRYRY